MSQDFDIFRLEPDGAVVWCEAATTLEIAKARVSALAASAAFPYIIRNQATGTQMLVKPRTVGIPLSRQNPKPLPPFRSPNYHICRMEDGRLRWIEAADTLQAAAARIKVLSALLPGDYLVLDYNPELRKNWTPPAISLSALYL
jgi:hypothetical protein